MSVFARDVNGVTNFCFDKMEEIDGRSDMDLKDKIKAIDTLLKHVWLGAKVNIEHKKLMLRAPQIAQNRDIILDLVTPMITSKPSA